MPREPTIDDGPDDGARPPRARWLGPRARRRMLRSTSVLPGLVTMLNGLAGFGAIHFATKDALGTAGGLGNLRFAAWLIFGAMVCDMLDGRLARMTRRTTDFGGQLDSLCDVISFGVAPGMLMLRTVIAALRAGMIGFVPSVPAVERVVWCIAAVYVVCAVLRLARFNVENDPDASAHRVFRGLPSPGAAAAVAALVLLLEHMVNIEAGWLGSPWLKGWLATAPALATVGIALPAVTLAVALLMVSRFPYAHLVNQYILGRRPFGYLVKLVLLLLVGLLEPFVVTALVATAYALSGAVSAAWQHVRVARGRQ